MNNEQLTATYTGEYQPIAANYQYWTSSAGRPPFTLTVVRDMCRDPRVRFGLWLIKGPILSQSRFFVDCDNPQVKKFLIDNIDRFWRTSAVHALTAIEWGFSVSEVLYHQVGAELNFSGLKYLQPHDVELVSKEGEVISVHLKPTNLYLNRPKFFHHLHDRITNPYYGQSRLDSAYIPWWEKWSHSGFRDIRRLWYFKNSFDGGTMFYPQGSSRGENGQIIPNSVVAREMITKMMAGGTLALPSIATGDQAGSRQWDYKPPQGNPAPSGLLEYGTEIDNEILESMGIPPEVISSGGNQGFGSSTGRQVPQTAFYAILQELVQLLISDFSSQILAFLVRWNYGDIPFNIIPFPLDPSAAKPDYNGNQFQDADLQAETPEAEGRV